MDVERTIEFILEQQAKFAANLVSLQERQDKMESQIEHIIGMQQGTVSILEGTLSIVRSLAERVDQLAEAQRHTEERLNALISIVDGLVKRQKPE